MSENQSNNNYCNSNTKQKQKLSISSLFFSYLVTPSPVYLLCLSPPLSLSLSICFSPSLFQFLVADIVDLFHVVLSSWPSFVAKKQNQISNANQQQHQNSSQNTLKQPRQNPKNGGSGINPRIIAQNKKTDRAVSLENGLQDQKWKIGTEKNHGSQRRDRSPRFFLRPAIGDVLHILGRFPYWITQPGEKGKIHWRK